MPRSMTGYGAAQAMGTRVAVEVDARSVNARSLKINLRTPAILGPRESELEALIRRKVRRGTLSLHVRLHFLRPQDAIRIRPEVVEGFAQALEPLRKKGLLEGKLTPDALAAIPGALETGVEDSLRPADWRVVKDAVTGALAELDAMRTGEAAHLVQDLLAIAKRMRKTLGAIRKRAPQVVAEYHLRLKERLNQLLAQTEMAIDDATLAREIAILADRADITEETTRLGAHLQQYEEYLASDGDVGRTLDFLTQEMLREVNTIGSKSNDVEIARAVIALKSDVDRLKEQSANLE